jgi:hypothetical protein
VIVLLLALATIVFAVVGAEFVRSTCRRQLMSPIVGRPQLRHAELE